MDQSKGFVVFGKMSRRIDINIESHRLLIIRRGGPIQTWCKKCRSQVLMITPNEAAAMMNISSRIIYRWIEEGKLHFSEDPGQSILICSDSLTKLSQ